ncbi:MAG: ABC transporter permease [Gammaproteobacteria bacterium]|nr:ABC transporter permease [Gammaproteobacteria bacterium]MCY3688900.1 ABC transporter permease [Gammaproteobacteria bacterium]MDE0480069.1 ABC transporter permease [Gammaproteobacteria bacterium]
MRALLVVFLKEIIDNLRDRRSMLTALLGMPIAFPVLFVVLISFQIERNIDSTEEMIELPVIGAEYAPNLMRYLESRNIDIVAGPADGAAAAEAVQAGEQDVVLLIPGDFGEDLARMIPATVELYLDQSDTSGGADIGRVRDALFGYNQTLAGIRLTARGVNPALLRPLNIDHIDVSTPSGRAAILLGMLSYFFLFAMLMGGMYLAIDATAGERERGSLEPLLSLPVTRAHLIVGKIAATCVFMSIALALCLLSFFVSLQFMPLEQLGMTPNFSFLVVVAAFLLLFPFTLTSASLMTLFASFTKSYKEAQTWLGVGVLIPTMPILFVSILQVQPRFEFMFIPPLSQHLILVDMISNEPVSILNIAISVTSTLTLGAILTWVCVRLYHREALLG